jgi:hypothetical protein
MQSANPDCIQHSSPPPTCHTVPATPLFRYETGSVRDVLHGLAYVTARGDWGRCGGSTNAVTAPGMTMGVEVPVMFGPGDRTTAT